jgi:tRNA modification GTPase
MYAADTIAAVATPPGIGGVGILRVSGPKAAAIAERVFAAAQPTGAWVSHRLYHGKLRATDGSVIDDGLAVLMRRPHSYTGEDVLELHCHGNPLVLRHVLAHVLSAGARPAEPGELTKRAFLNGRLDLAQAEAVADLVAARSVAGAALAAAQLGGHLSAALATLRDDLIHLKALIETQIDFPEEDVSIAPTELLIIVDRTESFITKLIDSYRHGALLRAGLRVAIVGKPNVGKSSLLNALLGSDRAIVTEIPGTTRDTIDEMADFGGIPVILTDTAGLRHGDEADQVERIGMDRTAVAMAQSQVLLVALDVSRPLTAEDRAVLETIGNQPHIVVLNKTDLPAAMSEADIRSMRSTAPLVRVSAKNLQGLEDVRGAVVGLVERDHVSGDDDPVISNARHNAALLQARDALHLVRDSIAAAQPPDLVAVDVQDALDYIGSITGVVSSEDVLDQIFSRFCIGK